MDVGRGGGGFGGGDSGPATMAAGARGMIEHWVSPMDIEVPEGAKASVALRFFALGDEPLNTAVAMVQQLFDGLRVTQEITGDDVLFLKQKFVSTPLALQF